jgi:UDP-4-amino-4,6-dideoxy-N-acetyl-beta-L-altrosamine N-acetyltransferase
MMLINGFGISLYRLSEIHLDMLREWRNSEFVQTFMQKRVSITPEMQKKWFESLDLTRDYYFIIEVQGDLVGCCNIKNVDNDGIGEGGVFLIDPTYTNGIIASKAVFLMYDWAFKNEIIKFAKSEILLGNKRAIRFNRMLGFSIDKKGDLAQGFLTEKSFYNQYEKYYKVLRI